MSKKQPPSDYERYRANVNRIIAELERELARLQKTKEDK